MENNTLAPRSASWREELRRQLTARQRTAIPRAVMPMLPAEYRVTCHREVNQGLSAGQAVLEATRCLDCPDPKCVTGCPVNIDIPGFIKNIQRGDIAMAARVLKATSALPAVCGRVCPQERQCESRCIYNDMHRAPVAIGNLERYAADTALALGIDTAPRTPSADRGRIAVAGSGPAGLSFAGSMAARGYRVTVFEALHQIGGVLKYGIPEFRLPNSIVDAEIDALKKAGVEFRSDTVIGKTLSYDDLMDMGFKALFVASGAGLPRFMDIPGENLNGIMSSNEYLTRVNLMHAGQPGYATPVRRGHRVAVIGAGNTAMDSVRTARRMGAEQAFIIYRRSDAEMPARVEEIEHARQEGVQFITLANPVEYLGDDKGNVRAVRVQHMELGAPDASGRRSPGPIPGKISEIEVDEVIVSVGVSPNPLIPDSIPGLEVSRRGTLVVADNLQTSMPLIFAGGDIVRGGATVILAMGDGRAAASWMADYLEKQAQ